MIGTAFSLCDPEQTVHNDDIKPAPTATWEARFRNLRRFMPMVGSPRKSGSSYNTGVGLSGSGSVSILLVD
jgi:hypothetical protein